MFFVKSFFFFFFLHIACSDIHAPKYSWDNESFVKVLVGKVLSKFTTKSDILKLFLWGLNQSESRTRTIHFININCKYLVIYKYLVNKYFVRYFASDYKTLSANPHCYVIFPASLQWLVIFEAQVTGSKQPGCRTESPFAKNWNYCTYFGFLFTCLDC